MEMKAEIAKMRANFFVKNVFESNRDAWDAESKRETEWCRPISPAVIEAAREGRFALNLTGRNLVPRDWFPASMKGLRVLALASGGGQQAPILAATGAVVTSFDLSDAQLEKDRLVAEREALQIRFEQGNMMDLSRFSMAAFDLIFNPCSVCFVPDVKAVWRECYRVLRPGGILLTGFLNPMMYLFDPEQDRNGILAVKHVLPYSDVTDITTEERDRLISAGVKYPHIEFSHTLQDLIGGQIEAGFMISGFKEGYWSDEATTLNRYAPVYIETRSIKTGA